MITNPASIVLAFLLANVLLANSVLAAESGNKLSAKLAAGKLKAEQICANCHGLDGQAGSGGGGSSVNSPNLTAQPKPYLKERLKDYKSGKIEHPLMTLVAKMLTDQDIDNVSEWYSGFRIDSPWFSDQQTSMTAVEETTGENISTAAQAGKLKVMQICANCHGLYGRALSGGNSALTPILTAQQKEHLVKRLKDYQSGLIQHSQMSLVVKMLTEQDINNVSAWYSEIQITVVSPEQQLPDQ